ncbi:hypothetical protein M514_05154 [Trichuris suis]|uniref:C2H2-type domain-containing protein n=1 Tax=Trichuris suis TaxID=68888 RepID=A0A085MZV6_9BILA|nr:hypothetical protein M513_05154 [Trichuris suis]KFD62752.1 hypothetical protein M514_05154 [Trichuris suis]
MNGRFCDPLFRLPDRLHPITSFLCDQSEEISFVFEYHQALPAGHRRDYKFIHGIAAHLAKAHRRAQGVHEAERESATTHGASFRCALCTQNFSTPSRLNLHKRRHGGSHLADWSFDRQVVWPTGRLADWSFSRQVIWPTGRLADWSFGRLVIWPTRLLDDRSFGRHVTFLERIKAQDE